MLLPVGLVVALGLGFAHAQGGCTNDDPKPANCPNDPKVCPYDLSKIDHSLDKPTSANKWWKPSSSPTAPTWQIILGTPAKTPDLNKDAYDFDMFDGRAAIAAVKKADPTKKIICYFSAGSSETWRCDNACFKAADQGGRLCSWPGERWLNTKSANVRNVTLARLDVAKSLGCDAVDPDNMDPYDNGSENDLKLTEADAVDYFNFIADAAHARNMAVGLKNAASIADRVMSKVDFSVNEECLGQGNCEDFQTFITNKKPVFNIEYPSEDENEIDKPWTVQQIKDRCALAATSDSHSKGFSILLKNHNLNDWSATCPYDPATPPDNGRRAVEFRG